MNGFLIALVAFLSGGAFAGPWRATGRVKRAARGFQAIELALVNAQEEDGIDNPTKEPS